jgi:hypothetical protein
MVAAIKASWMRRTWKREVATILLFIHTGVTLFLLIIAGIDRIGAVGGIYGVWTALVYAFVLGAFGLDALSKQLSAVPVAPGVSR